jgi:hypothetical protein
MFSVCSLNVDEGVQLLSFKASICDAQGSPWAELLVVKIAPKPLIQVPPYWPFNVLKIEEVEMITLHIDINYYIEGIFSCWGKNHKAWFTDQNRKRNFVSRYPKMGMAPFLGTRYKEGVPSDSWSCVFYT